MLTNILAQHHAHLWVSDPATLETEIVAHLQKLFCKKEGCGSCNICLLIVKHEHPCITIINPEGLYNIEDIDDVLESVKFKLDQNEQRFFIFYHAQDMTSACSNRLLKTVEEPHKGYYFVFLATRTDTILPTIVSRCFVKEFGQQHTDFTYQEILEPFIQQNFTQPLQFLRLIDKLDIKEQASKDIVDTLIAHFHQQLKNLHSKEIKDLSLMTKQMNFLVILKKQLSQLPAQGSSKIFWKNMFISFHAANNR